MQSHKWLSAHEKPSAEPVKSAVSVATRHVNVEQSESSQKQQRSKKTPPEVIRMRDMAWKVQAELRKWVERARRPAQEPEDTKPQQRLPA